MTAGPGIVSGASGGVGAGVKLGVGETACTADVIGRGETALGLKTIGADPNLNIVSKRIGT